MDVHDCFQIELKKRIQTTTQCGKLHDVHRQLNLILTNFSSFMFSVVILMYNRVSLNKRNTYELKKNHSRY